MKLSLVCVGLALLLSGGEALRSRKKASSPDFNRMDMSLKSSGDAEAKRDLTTEKARWNSPTVTVVHLQTAGQTAAVACAQTMMPFFPPGDRRYNCDQEWPTVEGCVSVSETPESPTTRGGIVGFTPDAEVRKVPETWTTWGHGYQSTAYYFGGEEALFRMPAGTGAFSLFIIPNDQVNIHFEVGTWDGSVFETSLEEHINGNMEAEGFAICSTGEIEFIKVEASSDSNGFAAGEFSIGTIYPEIFVGGDPHVVGYHGEKFDFKGEPGKVFNLLTDSDVQLNALFDHSCTRTSATIIKELGLATTAGDLEVTIRNQGVFVDGLQLMPGHHQLHDNVIALVHEGDLVDVAITLERYTVSVSSAVNRCGDAHLQVSVRVLDEAARPHGLMGQTKYALKERSAVMTRQPEAGFSHHVGEGQIEGYGMDYMVAEGLFGKRFAYNRFRKEQHH